MSTNERKQETLIAYLSGAVNGTVYAFDEITDVPVEAVAFTSGTCEMLVNSGLEQGTIVAHLANGQRTLNALEEDDPSFKKLSTSYKMFHETYYAYVADYVYPDAVAKISNEEEAEAYGKWFAEDWIGKKLYLEHSTETKETTEAE